MLLSRAIILESQSHPVYLSRRGMMTSRERVQNNKMIISLRERKPARFLLTPWHDGCKLERKSLLVRVLMLSDMHVFKRLHKLISRKRRTRSSCYSLVNAAFPSTRGDLREFFHAITSPSSPARFRD